MEVRIKLSKQMLATAKLVAIISMPDETDKINKYLNEDSEEVVDLDFSILEEEQQQQIGLILGMSIIAQKSKEDNV